MYNQRFWMEIQCQQDMDNNWNDEIGWTYLPQDGQMTVYGITLDDI